MKFVPPLHSSEFSRVLAAASSSYSVTALHYLCCISLSSFSSVKSGLYTSIHGHSLTGKDDAIILTIYKQVIVLYVYYDVLC
ncbi:hypothetical protein QL285_052582 [Trifolium repens]|nr:hypothetical protein QL285_052582 [Trifolium repens]